jgi:hypothetical protein
VSLLYADTSALVRAYFADEPDHAELRATLLEGQDLVVTSELARVELANAVRSAARAGRLKRWREVLARFDAHCQPAGPIALLKLRPDVLLPAAYRLVLHHELRTLDALHLATAVTDCPELAQEEEDVAFITRDSKQATVAKALGFDVA